MKLMNARFKPFVLAVFAGFLSLATYAQATIEDKSTGKAVNKFHFGIESEIMTWINNGYHGSFWFGRNGLRVRVVVASVTYPQSLNPEGFKNLTSDFYEIEFDYFFGKRKNEFRGLWCALGSGYTQQSIQSMATNLKRSIDLIDLHTGVGYALNLYKGLYINPWVGLSIHLNAPTEVNIGAEIWNPRKVDPVFGAKLGYSF
jgi:hypothetical protein